MTREIAEKDKKGRKIARLYIYVDILFIILPFILSLIISILINGVEKGWESFSISDFSLAAAMVYGQTLFRFNGGLGKYSTKAKFNVPVSLLWQALIVFGLIVSVTVYTIAKPIDDPSCWWIILQILIFISSLYCFITFGGLGQWLSDRVEEK